MTQTYIFLAEFGLYDKYKEINFMSMSENIISGNGDKFNQNDFAIDTKEGRKRLVRTFSGVILQLFRN